jgi:hypothetical protein
MSLNDKNLDRLISEALAIEAEEAKEAGALGFMARVLVQATMPHKKTESLVFHRQNGDFNLSITSPHPKIGLPYGSVPRLLLAWITTEAVRTGEQELVLGDSMSDFMRQLDLVPTGGRWGSIIRLKDQTKRLFSCSVHCFVDNKEQFTGRNLQVAKDYSLWWEPKGPSQKTLWQSSVLLDQAFFEEITDRPVPVDMRALQAIKQSPLALDIYTWLTYRMSYLKHKTEIPWKGLQMQFGADYALDAQGVRNFKRNFLNHLKKVTAVYPEANVSDGDYGLLLKPSKPHVGKLK